MNFLRKRLAKYYEIPGFKFFFELIFVILPIAFMIRTFVFGLYQVPSGSMETTLLVGERFFADKLTYWFKKPEYGDIIAFNDPNFKYSKSLPQNLWERYVSWNVSNWTKRLIGKPGDHIKGVLENGKPVVYRNGVKLDEPYVNKYPIISVWKRNPRDYRPGQLFEQPHHKSYDPAYPFDSEQQPYYRINPNLVVHSPYTNEPSVLNPGTPHAEGKDEFDITLGENQYWAMGDNRLGSYDSRMWGPLDGKLIHGKIVFRIWSMDSDESWWFVDLIKHPVEFWKKIRWSRCCQFIS